MDREELEHARKKAGVSREDLCQYLGISVTTYYRKCNGKSEFTLTEIKKIVELLKLDSPVAIFFPEKVS